MSAVSQDVINSAIAAAMQVAAQVPAMPASQAAPTVVGPNSGVPSIPSRARSLEDAMASAGANVELWLALDAGSFRVGTDNIKTLEAELTLREIQFPYMVRLNVGGATRFPRSYDGVREAQGGKPWAEVIAEAQRLDPNCKGQYDAAEIPLVLTSEVTIAGKTHPVGTRVGVTTPVTGYRPFMTWLRSVQAAHGADATVKVRLSVETKTKAGCKPWGIPVFTLL